jgi:hypothetical protein
MLAGFGRLNHLRAMLRVWRAQNHAFNARIGQRRREVGQKVNAQANDSDSEFCVLGQAK